jgi:hypothetical protein
VHLTLFGAMRADSPERRTGRNLTIHTGLRPLAAVIRTSWPAGTRLICRLQRPHPRGVAHVHRRGRAPLPIFITNQHDQDIAALEAQHRQHAEVENAS